MIFLKFDSDGKISYIHHAPFDEKHGLKKSKEQLKKEGVLVEQLPEKLEEIEGKQQVLYLLDGQLVWKYEDMPLTPEEIQAEKIQELETALLEMTTLNAIQQQQNEQAIMELTMMIGGM